MWTAEEIIERGDIERIELHDVDGFLAGVLGGFDLHGNGRRNKLWSGSIGGAKREFNNLKEIRLYARLNNLKVTKH